MKLLRVRFNNCRNIPDGDYRLSSSTTGEPYDTVLITGPQASGKTSFLQAIALAKERLAPYGATPNIRVLLRPGAGRGVVELTWLLSDDERKRAQHSDVVVQCTVPLHGGMPSELPQGVQQLLRVYSHKPEVGIMELFGANRTLAPGFQQTDLPVPTERLEGFTRLDTRHEKYGAVVGWLRKTMLQDALSTQGGVQSAGVLLAGQVNDSLAVVKQAIATMCPELRLVGLSPDQSMPWFERRNGVHLPLNELSDAEQDAVLLASTFVRIGLSSSLVLLDRLELFAHPADQPRWLSALGSLGQNNQLIIATTSEALLNAVPEAQVIRLDRNAGG